MTNPQWLADGSALIAASGARLSVFPATGHAARSIDLPARVTRLAPVPGGARVVLQLGPAASRSSTPPAARPRPPPTPT
ncbi:MAG: hypothetical protein HS111_29185 [Kofleriaceae bacterium]|nr:hypothetical protein [Kofleriaceae bacterium]